MTTSPPVETLISVPEAAKRLGLARRTAYRWAHVGHLVSKQDPYSGRIGVTTASVEAAAARRVIVP